LIFGVSIYINFCEDSGRTTEWVQKILDVLMGFVMLIVRLILVGKFLIFFFIAKIGCGWGADLGLNFG